VCVFDPRHARVKKKLSLESYLAHEHVVVSYNGDARGVVEDALGITRRVRCAVSNFHNIGSLVEGTALLATVPTMVARHIREARPPRRAAELPCNLAAARMDLLWPKAFDEDDASRFFRDVILRIAKETRFSAKL